MASNPRSFVECKALADAEALEADWQTFYRASWPAATKIEKLPTGATDEQWAGIDRVIHLRSGEKVLVEDKNRFKNEKTGKAYDDFLAEIFSNAQTERPGWTVDPRKKTQWVGYAIWPLRKAYLIQAVPLREAVIANQKAWLAKSGWRLTPNPEGFSAKNIPVSWKDLWDSGVTFGVWYFDKPHYRRCEWLTPGESKSSA